MLRVTRRRGCVAAYVWDYAEGMELIRTFSDAAVALDPAAADLDEARRFPSRRDALRDHLRAALPDGPIRLSARAWAVRGRAR